MDAWHIVVGLCLLFGLAAGGFGAHLSWAAARTRGDWTALAVLYACLTFVVAGVAGAGLVFTLPFMLLVATCGALERVLGRVAD